MALLGRIFDRIAEAHCTKLPAANPMGYVPRWDSPDNLEAAQLVSDLRCRVTGYEVYATSMNRPGDQYCILPSGSQSEFPEIDAECKKRGIGLQFVRLKAGGRIYRIPACDVHKLPFDGESTPDYKASDEYYLSGPDWKEHGGHGIYPLNSHEGPDADFISTLAVGGRAYKWEDVKAKRKGGIAHVVNDLQAEL